MLPGVVLLFMNDLAEIDPVLQHQVQSTAGKPISTPGSARRTQPGLAEDALGFQLFLQQADRAQLEVAPEYMTDGFGLGLVDEQFPVPGVISQGRIASHPHSLLLRGRDLVPDPLTSDLALELGEG